MLCQLYVFGLNWKCALAFCLHTDMQHNLHPGIAVKVNEPSKEILKTG